LGYDTCIPRLSNDPGQDTTYHGHHIAQVEEALNNERGTCVYVAHSGAGTLIGALDPAAVTAYVMLDAIFPQESMSRFELFDDPSIAEKWRSVASDHGGYIPAGAISALGQQIEDPVTRAGFIASLRDVPIGVYEERAPLHPDWPSESPGLYLQWTDAYRHDAERARHSRFQVTRRSASHLELINNPIGVAADIVRFIRAIK
jgi:hypothetical protein